ncbi:MAG TPA: zinc ABC transporter substrate-binding protein [Candidatus Paceibacterota bacterium]|nr:zinc ABC transporter substrate-binding protein [Candidatus Paceibacterota bacterium]
MYTKKVLWIVIAVIIIAIVGVILVESNKSTIPAQTSSGKLQVVAGENFWGSLVSQIGGSDISVTTIVTDPNADPHDYEATSDDAKAVADAGYVIENGVGYDTWLDKLIASSDNPNIKVLKIADLVGKKDGDNPHLWYQPAYVNQAIAQIEQDLITLDPAHASDYRANYATLQQSLAGYQNTIASIKQNYAGVKVAATEDIFVYLTDATGLDLVTPPAFIQAVGDGNDPPASTVATFQDQLKSGQVKVLLYNEQTVTPLTDSLKQLAQSKNIPIVGMTETVSPPDAKFQDWMGAQVNALQQALAQTR